MPSISLCGDGIYNVHHRGYGIGYKPMEIYNYEYNNNYYYIEVDRQRGGPTALPSTVVILAMWQ